MKIERKKSLDTQEAFILTETVMEFSGFQVFQNGIYVWWGCLPEVREKASEIIKTPDEYKRRSFYNSPNYRDGFFHYRWKPHSQQWGVLFGGVRMQRCINKGMARYEEWLINLRLP